MAPPEIPLPKHSGKFNTDIPNVATGSVDAPLTAHVYVSDTCRVQARMEGELIAEMRFSYFTVGPGWRLLDLVVDSALGRKLSEVAQIGEAELRALSDADPWLSTRWTPEKWEPAWRTIRSALRAAYQDFRQPGSGKQLKTLVFRERRGRTPSSRKEQEEFARIPAELGWDSE